MVFALRTSGGPMKVVAFLPVKGYSDRIENKNTKLLDGKPLFLHTLEKLVKCAFIDEVYLDSEDQSIFDLASEVACKLLSRDPKLADNSVDGNQLFFNEIMQVEADIYIQALCTSPFIEAATIEKGLKVLKCEELQYDSVVLVRKEKLYTWAGSEPKYDIKNIPNSCALPDTIIETMGLYLINRKAARATGRRIGEAPFLLEASPIEAVDVNYPEDFELAELIAAGKRENERKLFTNLAHQLTSSLLSDVLDDLKIENKVITGLTTNLNQTKLFGRAKTLKLCKATPEDTTTIYDALDSYSTIVPGDIIIVDTELPYSAYFGELNANLAMRRGAIGAIIDGYTRDSEEVKKLNFPVYAYGYCCKDIKTKGTLESINKTVNIQEVSISYEDLVFADSDGIIVIPKKLEEIVLTKCFEVIQNEHNILSAIAEGISIEKLRQEYGKW